MAKRKRKTPQRGLLPFLASQILASFGLRTANTGSARKVFYKGVLMDSRAEAKFAKLCDQHGVRWRKNETRRFRWTDGRKRQRWYVPDFYLPDFDLWVEIKGRKYFKNCDRTKWKHFPHNHEVVWASRIRLPKQVQMQMGRA